MFIVFHLTQPFVQLKYHETGKEKDCLPQVGQWNMMNKVFYFLLCDDISSQVILNNKMN